MVHRTMYTDKYKYSELYGPKLLEASNLSPTSKDGMHSAERVITLSGFVCRYFKPGSSYIDTGLNMPF